MTDKTKKTKTSSRGVGFSSLLTLLFIGLKLTGHITWSWIWVLSPLWITFSLIGAFLLLTTSIVALAIFLKGR